MIGLVDGRAGAGLGGLYIVPQSDLWRKRARVGKDMLVESPAKVPHQWMNQSDTVFRVLVVKVLKPTEETKLL